MKRRIHPASFAQRGYSVVELLIAGTLGLVLLAGIGSLFLGSSQTFRLQRQLADIQDSGRYALWMFRQELQRAGWRGGDISPNAANVHFFPPADSSGEGGGAIENMPVDFCPAEGCSVDGGELGNDSLTIGYDDVADCAGSGAVDGHVYNRYFVQDRQLLCAGSGGAAAQPLVEDVEAFQVLYGIDVLNSAESIVDARFNCLDRVVDRYVPASDVAGSTAVIAVRISLLVAGETNQSIVSAERRYQVGDQSYVFEDRIPRRVFSLTVPVRNVDVSAADPSNSGKPCPSSIAL